MPVWLKPVAGFQAVVPWQLPHSAVVAMWPVGLPAAVVAVVAARAACRSTCAWSTRVAGLQAAVAWQASQVALVKMCAAFLPAAFTPSWQVAQSEVMPVWLKLAGTHASVEWQVPHSPVVGMWFVPLPVAFDAVVAGAARARDVGVVDARRGLPRAGRVAALAARVGRDVRACPCRSRSRRCGSCSSCR